jgi:hypothetical protein
VPAVPDVEKSQAGKKEINIEAHQRAWPLMQVLTWTA